MATRKSEQPHSVQSRIHAQRFVVGVVVEGMNNYGRLILRGIHRYANVRREWLLHEELRPSSADFSRWPMCDGLIVAGLRGRALRALARRSRYAVSCSITTSPQIMPVVSADNFAIGQMAGEHLLDRQLKHFAFYDDYDRTGRQRRDGFRHAIKQRGFTCTSWAPAREVSDRSSHSHWQALLEWVGHLPKPVGILARDDQAGSDLAAACLSGDFIVPDQVAVVAVNNDDVMCEAAYPPLSSVQIDFTRVGYTAAQQLDTLLHGGTIDPDRRLILVPPESVVGRLSSDVRSIENSALALAVAYIREHGRTGCAVSEVVRVIGTSRSWLERQFQDKLGRTPYDEITRVRMEHARRLLLSTNEPVHRIATRCGFSAAQNFDRAFAKHEGVTPAAYRRSHSDR